MDDKERNKMPISKLMDKAKAKLKQAVQLQKSKIPESVKAAIRAKKSGKAEKVPLGSGSLNKAKQALKPTSRQKQIEDALKKSGV